MTCKIHPPRNIDVFPWKMMRIPSIKVCKLLGTIKRSLVLNPKNVLESMGQNLLEGEP